MLSFFLLVALVMGISFVCSLLEATILSVQPAYLALKIKDGRKFAHILQKQKNEIHRSIGAVLTLNTFANTMGATLVGSKAHEIWGETYITIVSAILTLAILIFSEIVPKTLGARNWKTFAPIAAYVVAGMILSLYPIVWLTEWITDHLGGDSVQKVSREEVIMHAELGAREGSLLNKESLVIKNLLMLDRLFVADIMTPRSVMFALRGDMTVQEVGEKFRPLRYSRIPVYQEQLDNMMGMTHRYKIMEALTHDRDSTKISELTTPIQTVSEKLTVSQVLDFFIKQKEHVALVVDEYGIITGLISLEDAVETLLGVEIVDEFDSVADLRQYALEQWQIRKGQGRKS
jgi:CBS domain containing-hemolysin-like protein